MSDILARYDRCRQCEPDGQRPPQRRAKRFFPPPDQRLKRGWGAPVYDPAACTVLTVARSRQARTVCGRYLSKDQRALERELHFLDVRHWPDFDASYNVAPMQLAPVIIQTPDGAVCERMLFGMIPFFLHGERPKFSTINAKVENLATGATWRGPWKRGQRCLVLASGYYEWHVMPDGRTKQPYLIHPTDQDNFAFAGLWDQSKAADGTVTRSFAIITLPASPLLAEIHNAKKREPAILQREDMATWLHGTPEQAHAVLRQYPDERLVAYPISPRLNNPRNNGAELIEPLKASAHRQLPGAG